MNTPEFDLKSFMESLALSEWFKIISVTHPPIPDPNLVEVKLCTPEFAGEVSVTVNWVPQTGTMHFSLLFEFNFDTEDEELMTAAMLSFNSLASRNYIARGYVEPFEGELSGVVAFSFEVPAIFLSTEAGKTALWEVTRVNFERMLREASSIIALMTQEVRGTEEDTSEEIRPTIQ